MKTWGNAFVNGSFIGKGMPLSTGQREVKESQQKYILLLLIPEIGDSHFILPEMWFSTEGYFAAHSTSGNT